MYDIISEFIGSFIFFSVILIKPEAIAIGLALIVGIYFASPSSGGHLNPAVSSMMWLKGTLSSSKLLLYVLAQLSGAICAYYFVKGMEKNIYNL